MTQGKPCLVFGFSKTSGSVNRRVSSDNTESMNYYSCSKGSYGPFRG